MVQRLYHSDSYLQEFNAHITAIDEAGHSIFLDRTAFYPGGGGQPCDFGWFIQGGRSWQVEKTRRAGDEVEHVLVAESSSLPDLGGTVVGRLDWDRRYRLMRTHTAMHLLCGVIFRDYGALVTGGEMDLNQARMDFEFESMTHDLVLEIETAVNLEVDRNHEIRVRILPREEAFKIPDLIRTKINLLPSDIAEVRTVEIVDLDMQADGGTHVRTTGEVGKIRIVDYKSKGKINKRLYVELD